jgi:hypothetical protein
MNGQNGKPPDGLALGGDLKARLIAPIGENPIRELSQATLPSKPLTFSGASAEISCPPCRATNVWQIKKGRAANAARPVEFREESPPGVGKGGISPLVTIKEWTRAGAIASPKQRQKHLLHKILAFLPSASAIAAEPGRTLPIL